MANLYGSSSYGYTAKSRSIVDQYTPADPSYAASSRLFTSDPLSSTSNLYNYSSISDRSHYKDTIGAGGAALWSGPPGVDVDVNAASVDSLYAGYKRSSAEALYHQSLLGTHNTIGQSEAWYSTNPLGKRPRFQSSLPVYPQRPGEKDCAHYMLTRTCKFGESCRFDHPMWVPEGGIPDWKEVPVTVTGEDLPERPGAPDCPFYLKTQMCKFGPRCKFNHPKDKVASLSAIENTDGSVLPERPSEPPCVFYMKTGQCKFGLTCKFHHPKDVAIAVAEVENGNGGQIEAITAGTNGNFTLANPPFTPAMLHNSKGLPIRPGEADCPFYLKTGRLMIFNHSVSHYVMIIVEPLMLTGARMFNKFESIPVSKTFSFKCPKFDLEVIYSNVNELPMGVGISPLKRFTAEHLTNAKDSKFFGKLELNDNGIVILGELLVTTNTLDDSAADTGCCGHFRFNRKLNNGKTELKVLDHSSDDGLKAKEVENMLIELESNVLQTPKVIDLPEYLKEYEALISKRFDEIGERLTKIHVTLANHDMLISNLQKFVEDRLKCAKET